MSVMKTVALATSAMRPPAASITDWMLRKASSVCSVMSSEKARVTGSEPVWPDTNNRRSTWMAGEYGRCGSRPVGGTMTCRFMAEILRAGRVSRYRWGWRG